MNIWDSIVIGSGSAGATASLYLSRGCLKNLLLTGDQRGGLLTTTHIVENFPGIFPSLSGPDLMDIMINQAAHYGAVICEENVIKIQLFQDNPYNIFEIMTRDNNIYYSKSIVFATGSTPKFLNAKGELEYNNKGVSYCAVCDAFLYVDHIVAVIGGGNSALEEALFLSNTASHVHLIHRRDEFRGEKILYEEVKRNPKITIHYSTVVEAIKGNDLVESLLVKNLKNNETYSIDATGIFIAIGHTPNTSLIKELINLDEYGYVIAENTKTNIKGFFVAGDVQDSVYRQAVTAAASGCIAALEIIKYLQSL